MMSPAVPSLAPRYRDVGLFVLTAALFGISFVAIKTGLARIPPILFAGLRFDLAAVVLLGYVVLTRQRSDWVPRTAGDVAGIVFAGLFLIVGNNAFLFVGQGYTTPAAASVMYGLNPVLAPLFAWWLLEQRLSWLGALGILTALGGVVVIVQPSPAALAGTDVLGQALVLCAAAAVALGSVGLRRIEPRMESAALTTWAMALGAVLLHGTSIALGEVSPTLTALPTAVLLSVVAVAIPATAVAYPVYFALIERVGPVRTNLMAYAVPAFAALFGWLLLGQGVAVTTVVGFFVVLVGFALVERTAIREEFARFRGPPAVDTSGDD
jgi:drug/metabolite transporter (DMT)-like permease